MYKHVYEALQYLNKTPMDDKQFNIWINLIKNADCKFLNGTDEWTKDKAN
jgi:hypothetical protein